jgi:protein-S-isoprenylcysteine O-methyltransferase Ste14
MVVILFPVSEAGLAFALRAKSSIARHADDGSLTILWTTIAFSVGLAMFSAGLFGWAALPVSPVVRDTLVLVLLGLGLPLRWASIVILGRFFTVDVAIHQGHTVVERGPYRYVRHPSYTGILIAFLGVGVYCGNWVSLLIVIVPITLAFSRRIRTEELALLRDLGSEYARYRSRTAKLIPGVF